MMTRKRKENENEKGMDMDMEKDGDGIVPGLKVWRDDEHDLFFWLYILLLRAGWCCVEDKVGINSNSRRILKSLGAEIDR